MSELTNLSIAEARSLLDSRQLSAVELAEAHIARCDALEPRLNCHIELTPEIARQQAHVADTRIAAGEAGPLTGIPASIKDVLVTVDSHTTAGSQILKGYRSPYDATVVRKLREAGSTFIGKGNTDEFAMGSSTENSSFFPTHNPWDIERVPGGSSGGPAAAVAAGESHLRGWFGHGRFDPPAGRILRSRRSQTDLRPGLTIRFDRVREQPRSDRAVHPLGRRRRHRARGNCRAGPARFHQLAG